MWKRNHVIAMQQSYRTFFRSELTEKPIKVIDPLARKIPSQRSMQKFMFKTDRLLKYFPKSFLRT